MNVMDEYGRFGRESYFFGVLGLAFLNIPFLVLMGAYAVAPLLISIGLLSVKRLQNIGCPKALGIVIFIPLANFFLYSFCLCAPKGFAHTKRMDIRGWFAGMFMFFILVGIMYVNTFI